MTDNNGRRNPHLPEPFVHKPEGYHQSPNRILQTKYAETFTHYKEQGQFRTPLKVDPNKENVGASPMQWNSPSMTPPPSFSATKTPVKSDLIKNPFDTNATEHLHLETFSPSVFSRVLSPSEDQDSNWRIEHIAVLNPTEFSPNVHNHFTDPTMEEEAQEKILQFFSQKQIAPSPWSNPRSKVLVRSKLKTPREQSPTITSKNTSTQTSLSFPPVLPPEVEEVLRQYCCDPQEHTTASPSSPSGDCDDSSLNASSLRRKLFAQISGTPPTSGDAETCYTQIRGPSSSPIQMTGPHSSRYSFSPCSRPVSPPVLSPIFSHREEASVMDETTRQSWSVPGSQPSSYPEQTVLMETYEGGYFSCSSNAVQSREMNLVDESNAETANYTTDKVGQPKECSTPTKNQFY